jgi:excisionase family DNA binding protein
VTELSKKEAAEHLGISQRALERYTQQGRVSVKYVKATRGRQARYDLVEINELRQQLEEPLHRPAVETSLSVVPLPPERENKQVINLAPSDELVRAVVEASNSINQNNISLIEKKLLLTLKEAQMMTGLGKATLKKAMSEGKLKAKRIGGSWRIKPDDLKSYIREL